MIPITLEVAQRLESAEAADGAGCAEAQDLIDSDAGATVLDVAGGVAAYVGADSPLTHALGMGMYGAVTETQLDELEDFYESRGAILTIDVCPYADATLLELLTARRYRIGDFSNVLVRQLIPGEQVRGIESSIVTRAANADEAAAWARTTVCGFFGRNEITDEEERLGRILFRMPKTTPILGLFEGEPAAACSMSIRNGVASCFADATLIPFRRRGAHRAMICERLRLASSAGCDLATAGTQPGSGSQRNFESVGFQVAYTKITMTRV